MRARLSEKIETLKAEAHTLRSDLIRQRGNSQAEIESLNVKMQAMSKRLMKRI